MRTLVRVREGARDSGIHQRPLKKGQLTMNHRRTKSHAKSAALAVAFAVGTMGYAYAADLSVKAPGAAGAGAGAVPTIPFFIVNDTSVSFTYFPKATDPGVSGLSGSVPGGVAGAGNTIPRYLFSFDHFDVWQYGTNLIHGEFNQYGKNDPNAGIPGSKGAREFFGFWTGTLGFNEISGTKAFSTFLSKDVSFMLNLTGGVENNFLSPETTQIAPGLQVTLNLPGVVNVGITAYKEWSHSSFDACGPTTFGVSFVGTCASGGPFSGDRDFEWTWKLFSFVSEPIPGTPVTFVNVLNVTGPKGTGISPANCLALGCFGAAGAFNNNETKTEVFEDARLSFDTSKVLWGKPGIWDTYVGYRYWSNKFGTNHSAALFSTIAPSTSIESTAYFGTTYHFK
jgi:hypothetical protein